MIHVRGLSKVYHRGDPPAIDSIDMDIHDSEIVGFVGLNGAGKTTAIRSMIGVILPTSGTVSIDGSDIVKEKAAASMNVGWVPETPVYNHDASALTLLKYFAGFFGISPEIAERRAMELLERLSLSKQADRRVMNYSQGMKKRFAIAAAMIHEPNNYLFDETLNGIDAEGVELFRTIIRDLRKDGKAVLLSSHILSEIEDSADRVIIIDHGKIIDSISIENLRNKATTRVEFTVSNIDGNITVALRKYGEVEIKGSTILVRGRDIQASAINDDLVKLGYKVNAIRSETLENYFLNLVRDQK
jgi:ABC-2 type transport system ATP-binding protein